MSVFKVGKTAAVVFPLGVCALIILLWYCLVRIGIFPTSVLPGPFEVYSGFMEELLSGRFLKDLVASLYRVVYGFLLAVLTGIPLGLFLGTNRATRTALQALINFFRSLSPLAWIPFAILWFGLGDAPAVFLIFLFVFE
jgi:NitT/TauT family transport system permease protein